jgi:transcription elongation factor GreA
MNQLNQRVQMTPLGYRQLVEELELLEKNKRPEAIERLSKARDFGDLTENAEYHSAKEALSTLEGRVEELKDILTRVVVVDIQKAGLEMVGLGSVVHIEVNGSKHEYTIVGEWEADPAAKKISHESPLGKALMGKKVGEAVEVEAPSGVITYAIKSVK